MKLFSVLSRSAVVVPSNNLQFGQFGALCLSVIIVIHTFPPLLPNTFCQTFNWFQFYISCVVFYTNQKFYLTELTIFIRSFDLHEHLVKVSNNVLCRTVLVSGAAPKFIDLVQDSDGIKAFTEHQNLSPYFFLKNWR